MGEISYCYVCRTGEKVFFLFELIVGSQPSKEQKVSPTYCGHLN